jgi:hypothetical protein
VEDYDITASVDLTQLMVHRAISHDLLNSKLLQVLADINVGVLFTTLFFKNCGSTDNTASLPHVDSLQKDFVRLNWVYGGTGSIMRWFTPKENCQFIKQANTIGRGYYTCERDQIEFAHQELIQFPSLVQVGQPHDILVGAEPRYCVSMIIEDTRTHRALSMQDAQERFAQYLTC